jgi:alkylhydroperoxidase family enzyme
VDAAAQALEDAAQAAWAGTDPPMLELCDLRVAALLGDEVGVTGAQPREKVQALEEWPTSPLFSDAERAHLAFTEQFVTAVASVSDADVDALLAHAEPQEVFEFISALYVLEMRRRLDMTTRAVLRA